MSCTVAWVGALWAQGVVVACTLQALEERGVGVEREGGRYTRFFSKCVFEGPGLGIWEMRYIQTMPDQ